MDQLVLEVVSLLDPKQREDFEERSAILQFEAGYAKEHAECLALLDVLRRNPEVLSGCSIAHLEHFAASPPIDRQPATPRVTADHSRT
jgi:hypothetical protein